VNWLAKESSRQSHKAVVPEMTGIGENGFSQLGVLVINNMIIIFVI